MEILIAVAGLLIIAALAVKFVSGKTPTGKAIPKLVLPDRVVDFLRENANKNFADIEAEVKRIIQTSTSGLTESQINTLVSKAELSFSRISMSVLAPSYGQNSSEVEGLFGAVQQLQDLANATDEAQNDIPAYERFLQEERLKEAQQQ